MNVLVDTLRDNIKSGGGMVDVSHSGVDLVKHKMYWIHYRFESCPDYKKWMKLKS